MGEHTCDHGEGEGKDPLEEIAKTLHTSFNKHEARLMYRVAYYFNKDREFRNGMLEDEEANQYTSLSDLISEFDAYRMECNIDKISRSPTAAHNRSKYYEAHTLRAYIRLIEFPVMDSQPRFAHIEQYMKRGGPLPGLSIERIPLYHEALLMHFNLEEARPQFQMMVAGIQTTLQQGDFKAVGYQRGVLCNWLTYLHKEHNIPVILTDVLCDTLRGLKVESINKLLENANRYKQDPAKRDACIKQALEIPKFNILTGVPGADAESTQDFDYSWVEERALDIATQK